MAAETSTKIDYFMTQKPLTYSKFKWTPVTAIVGSPCAGKSTTVDEVAKPGDLVIEFDRLMMALTPLGTHEHSEQVKSFVWTAQKSLLRRLRYPSEVNRAFLTALAPTNEQRYRYLVGHKASMTILQVSPETAHNRAEEAGRPGTWHHFIDMYFERYEEPDDPRIKVFNTEDA